MLEEHDLWDIVKEVVTIPIDLENLATYNKRKIKSKRILLDVMKDHMIMHVIRNMHAYKMWEALTKNF